jgi:uncharacterized membrane protein (UPF0127 family)
MSKNLKIAIFFILIAGFAIWATDPFPAAPMAVEKLVIETTLGQKEFTVEIAQSQKQQELGLMYRTSLASDRGMIFIEDQDMALAMWMKNTLISLDMLFIDSEGKIVFIADHATPESTAIITPGRPVRAVIELAAGTADADHIKVGDRVIDRYFGKKP